MTHMRKIDFAAVDHSLKYRFHPGKTSIFPETQRALPGEAITFEKGKILRHQYWTLKANKAYLKPGIGINQFRKLLVQVIRENAQADVPGGYFVSGGLDSSLVTAIALQSSSSFSQPISL